MNDPSRAAPFQRLSSEVLVNNPWHRYCRDHYVRRDGSEGVYYYVDMPGSVGIIPLFEDGTTVLLRQHRYLLGVDLWEFPIGGMEPCSDKLAVAQRELAEEAGLAAATWTELGAFAPYKGVSNERCHFFLARGLTPVPAHPEPEESITIHRLPLLEARRRLLDQELGDGQSWAGLILLDRHLTT